MKNTTEGLSPKLYPALIAIATGLALILIQADDAIGTAILLTGIGGLGLGAALPPGKIVRVADKPKPKVKRKPQAGYTLVELVVGVLLILILVFVLLELAERI